MLVDDVRGPEFGNFQLLLLLLRLDIRGRLFLYGHSDVSRHPLHKILSILLQNHLRLQTWYVRADETLGLVLLVKLEESEGW